MPIGHFRVAERIFEAEKKRVPLFADSITFAQFDQRYRDRLDREIELADYILVPSDFVAETLLEVGVAGTKIIKLPYGSWFEPIDDRDIEVDGNALRLIFFGQISQRKGLSYLLDAVKNLRAGGASVSLTLAGNLFGSGRWMDAYSGCFKYEGMVSRDRLRELLRSHDLFVFPTLFEGSAYVIPESLSHGVPVVTTKNSGGEAIEDGVNGFIVPLCDVASIEKHILKLSGDREKLKEMKLASIQSSRDVTWGRYRKLLGEFLSSRIPD